MVLEEQDSHGFEHYWRVLKTRQQKSYHYLVRLLRPQLFDYFQKSFFFGPRNCFTYWANRHSCVTSLSRSCRFPENFEEKLNTYIYQQTDLIYLVIYSTLNGKPVSLDFPIFTRVNVKTLTVLKRLISTWRWKLENVVYGHCLHMWCDLGSCSFNTSKIKTSTSFSVILIQDKVRKTNDQIIHACVWFVVKVVPLC